MIRGKDFSCNIANSRIFCEMFKKLRVLTLMTRLLIWNENEIEKINFNL